MALPQVIRLLGVFEVCPVMRELEEHAEIALLGLQPADLRDGVVRCSDDELTVFPQILDRLAFDALPPDRAADAAKIVLPFLKAELHIFEGLRTCLGAVDRANQEQLLR